MPVCEAFAQKEQQPNIYDVVHLKYFDEEIPGDCGRAAIQTQGSASNPFVKAIKILPLRS